MKFESLYGSAEVAVFTPMLQVGVVSSSFALFSGKLDITGVFELTTVTSASSTNCSPVGTIVLGLYFVGSSSSSLL